MVDQIKIVGFAGSLRRASYNRGLIRAAAASAPQGITIEVYDLAEIPLYNQDVEDAGEPASVVATSSIPRLGPHWSSSSRRSGRGRFGPAWMPRRKASPGA